MRFSLMLIFLSVPAAASADAFVFKLEKGQCTGIVQPANEPIQVAIAVSGVTEVKLTAQVDLEGGDPLEGTLAKSKAPNETDIWRLEHKSKELKAKFVTITGSVDGKAVECKLSGSKSEPEPSRSVSSASMTTADFAAAEWLDSHDERFDIIRDVIAKQNPKWPLGRIVFLPHLPSGAKAPSYPTSISERDLAQVVMVVPDVPAGSGSGGKVEWALTRCEAIPNYRVYGSIEGLAEAHAAVPGKDEIEYKLVRIGHTMSCGADALAYSVAVTSDKGSAGETNQSTVPVRPVYHLGATATFGYDRTMQSTFVVRSGKIDEVPDRVGPGLLVGATYFIKGVDFGDMRWYNHLFNPFLVVSLEAPKDRFVAGTALTYRGGISLALGIAFNHVSTLASGFSEGQAFDGPGDIPLDKKWKKDFYIGVAVDDKLLASFRKLKKSGTGGGTAQPGAAEDAKKKQAEEEAKKKEKEASAGGTESSHGTSQRPSA
jgi:hypothetical protein